MHLGEAVKTGSGTERSEDKERVLTADIYKIYIGVLREAELREEPLNYPKYTSLGREIRLVHIRRE